MSRSSAAPLDFSFRLIGFSFTCRSLDTPSSSSSFLCLGNDSLVVVSVTG